MLPLEIDVHTVKQKLDRGDPFLLLDIREPTEYSTAHIDQALLIPMGQLSDRLTELEPYRQQDIVVHCHHGARSLRATNWLRAQGFERVQSMAGGIEDWSLHIDPAVPRY